MQTETLAAGNNILLPNATFFVELVIFLIVLLIVWKVILPPITKALKQREDMVSETAENNKKAAEALKAAEAKYTEALAEARAESGHIREEAREEGRKVLEEMRDRANAEVAQINQRGVEQLEAARAEVVAELRTEASGLSSQLASRILGEQPGAERSEGAR
ncbi:F0F1 ATP synthase subunit B [Sciscionella sediminilitoris]|uniref:F0F1 ATP synthase subunit B n=1 Tax=Sciscionella sediminilitoris TaxID=1445613 RepID=UPI0004DF26C1|nr:F0F1 ATP synthase subunit B [Sciscionella sp. SE31]